jgi:hypothetical protein
MNVKDVYDSIQISEEKNTLGTTLIKGRFLMQVNHKIPNVVIEKNESVIDNVKEYVRKSIVHDLYKDKDEALKEIASRAHAASTGPAAPDYFWEIKLIAEKALSIKEVNDE